MLPPPPNRRRTVSRTVLTAPPAHKTTASTQWHGSSNPASGRAAVAAVAANCSACTCKEGWDVGTGAPVARSQPPKRHHPGQKGRIDSVHSLPAVADTRAYGGSGRVSLCIPGPCHVLRDDPHHTAAIVAGETVCSTAIWQRLQKRLSRHLVSNTETDSLSLSSVHFAFLAPSLTLSYSNRPGDRTENHKRWARWRIRVQEPSGVEGDIRLVCSRQRYRGTEDEEGELVPRSIVGPFQPFPPPTCRPCMSVQGLETTRRAVLQWYRGSIPAVDKQ